MRPLGQYTLTTRLGKGGMGSVWKARHQTLGGVSADVAIKLIHGDLADEQAARQRFLEEARLCMLLRSSNIVTVFDVAEDDDGTCYIVMEWVDGLNLAQLCKKMWEKGESFSDAAVAYIVAEILKGLMHAHELSRDGSKISVIHRDVSPHNIILSTRGEVKLLDFGVARISSEDTTSPLTVKGKIRYMSPEQLRGKTRHPTVDLFPVGAILHELIDHRKFRVDAIDHVQLYGFALAGVVPPLSAETSAPAKLADVRNRLLAYDPHTRFQTAREVFYELIEWPGYRNATLEIEDAVRRHASRSTRGTDTSATYVVNGAEDDSGHAEQESAGAAADENASRQNTLAVPLSQSNRHNKKRSSETIASAPSVLRRSKFHKAMIATVMAATVVLVVARLGLAGDVTTDSLAVREQSTIPSPPMSAAEVPGPAPTSAPMAKSERTGTFETEQRSSPTEALGEPQPAAEISPAPTVTPQPVPAERPELTTANTNKTWTGDTRVTISLGDGLDWAQVEIAGTRFELDKWGSKTVATGMVDAGTWRPSYQTEVGAKWQVGTPVKVSGRRMKMKLDEGGLRARN